MPESAAAVVTPPNTTSAEGATGSGKWYESLQGEDRGFVETKGYENLGAMVKGHRNLETLLGAPKERILRLPDKPDAPEWGDIRRRLGQPEKPEGYELPVPQGEPKVFAEWAQGVFHKEGLSKAQGQAIAAAWNEHLATSKATQAEEAAGRTTAQMDKLKGEWGTAYDQNVAVANKVADAMGLTKEQYEDGERAFGVDGWAKFLHGVTAKFGIKLGEAEYVGNSSDRGFRGGKLTPYEASEELARLSRDPAWIKRLGEGDADTVAMMHKLHQAKYPGVQEF